MALLLSLRLFKVKPSVYLVFLKNYNILVVSGTSLELSSPCTE